MYISAKTIDDLLRDVFSRLLKSKNHISPSRNPATEEIGVLLELTNPRARLSRTEKKGVPFGSLGEFLWYLAGSNDLRFIDYYLPGYEKYSDDGKTIHGAYGPRLLNMRGVNQLENALAQLRSKDSRRVVIQLFDAKDLKKRYKDIPCTCTLQFLLRRRRLHMFSCMRSNDAFKGLPNDVFAFTMIQELFARALKVELGTYKHAVGSLHLYDENREDAQIFLDEGWQEAVSMPPMPEATPWKSVAKVLSAERTIRQYGKASSRRPRLEPYWEDLVRLLQIYWYYAQDRRSPAFSITKESQSAIAQIKRKMSSRVYNTYIEKKRRFAERKAARPSLVQAQLF